MSTLTAAMVETLRQAHPRLVGAQAPEDKLTEAGCAERFARLHADDVRYDHRRQRWLLWQGHRWSPDADGAITRLAITFARMWQRGAIDLEDRDRREAVVKCAIRLERRAMLQAVLDLASNLTPIADAGTWDDTPWLLGVPGGVVDLRTGTMRDGRRDDRITMSTSAAYDPEARSDRWDTAIREILPAPGLADYVQRAIGYSATGVVDQDVWFLTVGGGRNGKTTILGAARRALGDYGGELPASALDARAIGPAYDLATLPGRRFIVAAEAGDSIQLHHDRIKALSGGDGFRVADKYQRSFEFTPRCVLWLSANRRPRISDDSIATWARVRLVPFVASFAGREDRTLRSSLERDPDHQAAILAWLVRGARLYAREGLGSHEAVTTATREYEQDSDPIGEFLNEACDRDASAEVGAADLYRHYRAWADRHSLTDRERLTATAFGRRVSTLFDARRSRTGKAYLGLVQRSIGG